MVLHSHPHWWFFWKQVAAGRRGAVVDLALGHVGRDARHVARLARGDRVRSCWLIDTIYPVRPVADHTVRHHRPTGRVPERVLPPPWCVDPAEPGEQRQLRPEPDGPDAQQRRRHHRIGRRDRATRSSRTSPTRSTSATSSSPRSKPTRSPTRSATPPTSATRSRGCRSTPPRLGGRRPPIASNSSPTSATGPRHARGVRGEAPGDPRRPLNGPAP